MPIVVPIELTVLAMMLFCCMLTDIAACDWGGASACASWMAYTLQNRHIMTAVPVSFGETCQEQSVQGDKTDEGDHLILPCQLYHATL